MRACWMFMVLVGCRLSQCQDICKCNERLKNICVPTGDNVFVPCPNLTGSKEVKFNLLRDEEIIYNHTCSFGGNALNCTPTLAGVGVELDENSENKSVSFKLTEVNTMSYGIYRCEGIVMFPPPYITERDLRILVLIEGHQCNKSCGSDKTVGDQNCGFHWIWIIVLVSIYSIIVTIIAIVISVKLKRTDSQSDYMNTKPKPSRDRRRKKGVQNPIPRHF